MVEKKHSFSFEEYDSIDQLSSEDRNLVEAAKEAMSSSYAPYSEFNVGAAIRLDNGIIVRGSNQENVAFPAGLCAERTAMFAAGSNYPTIPMTSMAVVGGHSGSVTDFPIAPCGECRQVMAEYKKKYGKPMSLLMVGKKRIVKVADSCHLLPFIFDL